MELGPDTQLEAVFAIREAENMSARELVAVYESTIQSKDYIRRRAIEAAAGTVLKGAPSNESARFQMLKKSIYEPSSPEIKAVCRAVDHIEKMKIRLGYAAEQTKKTSREPFGKI